MFFQRNGSRSHWYWDAVLGGYGYSKEYPIEQKMRDAWGWGIAGGTIDIQKINIASALVGRRFDQRR